MKLLRCMLFSRVLFWGCVLAFASPAQAALIANSSVSYDEGLSNGTITITGVPANGGGTSAVGYNSAVVPGLATSGSATADYGALHAIASSVAANPGDGLTSQARAVGSAFWSDQLTFSSPTLTGQAYARAVFSMSGALNSISDPSTTGNSTIGAEIRVNNNPVFSTSGQLVSQSGVITIDDVRRGQAVNGVFDIEIASTLTGSFSFDIPFEFGVPFQMTGSLDAFTQALSAFAGNDASAHSNFGSSGLWGGISEVHLANGTVLNDYSLGSTSGFDWANAYRAVPEPATVWLLGTGLLIGVARRRER